METKKIIIIVLVGFLLIGLFSNMNNDTNTTTTNTRNVSVTDPRRRRNPPGNPRQRNPPGYNAPGNPPGRRVN